MPVLEIDKEYVQKSNAANTCTLLSINRARTQSNSTVTVLLDAVEIVLSLIPFERNWKLL